MRWLQRVEVRLRKLSAHLWLQDAEQESMEIADLCNMRRITNSAHAVRSIDQQISDKIEHQEWCLAKANKHILAIEELQRGD